MPSSARASCRRSAGGAVPSVTRAHALNTARKRRVHQDTRYRLATRSYRSERMSQFSSARYAQVNYVIIIVTRRQAAAAAAPKQARRRHTAAASVAAPRRAPARHTLVCEPDRRRAMHNGKPRRGAGALRRKAAWYVCFQGRSSKRKSMTRQGTATQQHARVRPAPLDRPSVAAPRSPAATCREKTQDVGTHRHTTRDTTTTTRAHERLLSDLGRICSSYKQSRVANS